MNFQRQYIFYYFFGILAFFYIKYLLILKNPSKVLDTSLLTDLDGVDPTLFRSEYLIFYDKKSPLARNFAIKIGEFLRFNVISISVFNLDHCDRDYRPDDATNYAPEDRTKPEGQFKIIVEYENVKNDSSFTLRVKGGNTLVFTVYSNTVFSDKLGERMFALTKKLFLDSGPIKMKQLKPMLDLNFVLMSDEGRVSWNLSEKVLTPYMNCILSVFSLFYDVYLHSRVVSNVDFLQKFVVESDEDSSNHKSSYDKSSKTSNDSDYVLFDLNKQDTNFYNFFEGIANVDVSMRDQHSFRHSLNFFVIVPSKPVFLKDPFTGQKRESFKVENLGVFTFLNGRTNRSHRKSNLDKNHNFDKNTSNTTNNDTNNTTNNTNENHVNDDNNGNDNNKEYEEKENENEQHTNTNTYNNTDPETHRDSGRDTERTERQYTDTDRDYYDKNREDKELDVDKKEDAYVLNDDDALDLVSTWVTYIRHMHHLPASKSEYMFSMSNPDEKVKILSENQFLVTSNTYSFKVTFDDPTAVAFYGFEINKLSTFFYNSYLKGTINNLKKLPSLATLSFNTQLNQDTFELIMSSFDALELGMGYSPPLGQKAEINGLEMSLQAMDTNLRALSLSRHAFFKSLEALSDDKMFNKNVLSYEHMLGVFMCDVFPYQFPVVLFYLKLFVEKFKSRKSN